MNKRMKKKLEKKKFASIPVGYGLITGGYLDYHNHKIDTLVRIDSVTPDDIFGDLVECTDLSRGFGYAGFHQTVFKEDIKMNLGGKR